MKLRWRFSATIRCASGSIQVVTKVAGCERGRRLASDHLLADRPGVVGGHLVGEPMIGLALDEEPPAVTEGSSVSLMPPNLLAGGGDGEDPPHEPVFPDC